MLMNRIHALIQQWIVVAAILAFPVTGVCKDRTVLQTYMDAMKTLAGNCSMEYRSTCYYPHNTAITVNGRLAMSGGNYYDSSNMRFVLMNKDWLVVADHQERLINTLYLPDWKKQMGKNFELDISGFLLNNVDLSDFSGFTIKQAGKDSFSVRVHYTFDGNQVLDLELLYPRGGLLPVQYSGTIKYPLQQDEAAAASGAAVTDYTSVQFSCFNILQTPNQGIFDISRLIKQSGNRAELKRYNNYKMYRSGNTSTGH